MTTLIASDALDYTGLNSYWSQLPNYAKYYLIYNFVAGFAFLAWAIYED